MNCPICGMEVNDTQFCPGCGANMSGFEGVSQDKVIINQTPAQQMAAGDDSVTQLIPENYMNTTGDDSVTQLIPENYMTAQGDDTATVMLDPSQVQQYAPNQQPVFNQAPTMAQQGMHMQGGYQQPYGQPQMSNQPTYAQNINPSYGPKTVSSGIKIYSLICLLALILALVANIIFVTKPIFYILQSYVGNVMDDDTIIEEMEEIGDVEDATMAYRIFIGVMIVFIVIAAINAWVAYARVNSGCMKSPVNKSVGAFVFSLLAFAIIAFLTFGLGAEMEDVSYHLVDEEMNLSKFNVYNLSFYLSLISTLLNLGAIFTSSSAKNATR